MFFDTVGMDEQEKLRTEMMMNVFGALIQRAPQNATPRDRQGMPRVRPPGDEHGDPHPQRPQRQIPYPIHQPVAAIARGDDRDIYQGRDVRKLEEELRVLREEAAPSDVRTRNERKKEKDGK